MSNKRDPRAPVKLDAEDLENDRLGNRPELSALKAKQNHLKTILKTECRMPRPLSRKNIESIPGSVTKLAVSGKGSSAAH